MPQCYPSHAPSSAPSSERKVFERFSEALPKDWLVIHGTPTFEKGDGRRSARDGEIDFVVIHPRRGILVLEVKGGRVGRDQGGWYSIDKNGRKHSLPKEPIEQAKNGSYSLKRGLEAKNFVPKGKRLFAYGLCFPDVRVSHDLSLGVPKELVMDRTALDDPKEFIEGMFDHHTIERGGSPSFLPLQVLQGIAPSFQLAPSLANQFSDEAHALLQLTEEQAQCLDLLEAHDRVVIEGAAGTGKTVVAMEKARRAAEAGRKALLLCYNRPLAEFLRPRAQGFKVQHFHGFCKSLAGAAGLPWRPPLESATAARTEFWEFTAPELLEAALAKLPDERFDTVIVDEGQDFKGLWWGALENGLAAAQGSEFYAFLDPKQNIYDGTLSADWGVAPMTLTVNCRNTVAIAKYSGGFVDVAPRTKATSPQGIAVRESAVTDERAAERAIAKSLHHWVNEEGIEARHVAVLTTDGSGKGLVQTGAKFGNFEMVPAADTPRGTQIRSDSLHRFKGLEARAVILYVSSLEHLQQPRHMYVATSRARHALHVIKPQATS